MTSPGPDADAFDAFLSLGEMEKAIEDVTGVPCQPAVARAMLVRGWTTDDLYSIHDLACHAIKAGLAFVYDQDTPDELLPLDRQGQALAFTWLPVLWYHDNLYGKTIALEWLRVIMSVAGPALDAMEDEFGDKSEPGELVESTTPILGSLAPLVWAANIPLDEALNLEDNPETRYRLTEIAEQRGFRFPST